MIMRIHSPLRLKLLARNCFDMRGRVQLRRERVRVLRRAAYRGDRA